MSKILTISLLLTLLSHGIYSYTYTATTASAWDDQDFFSHCPVSRCSDGGPEIRFPHRLQSSNTSSACGGSCIHLTCSGQDTILNHLFLGPCKVTAIDYKEAVIKIIPLDRSPCPLQKLIINSSQLFDDYSSGCAAEWRSPAKIVRCSKEFTPSGTSPVDGSYSFNNIADYIIGPISCLSDTINFSYLVFARLYMHVLPLDCKIVPGGSVAIPYDASRSTFKETVERIISPAEMTVSWVNYRGESDITGQCTDCERRGRACAFSSQRRHVFCMGHQSQGTIANCPKSCMITPPLFYFLK